MKKYKLIKWYPSLPEWFSVGSIVEESNAPKGVYYKSSFVVRKNEVEENPEFWEEIVEKDYEILKLSLDAVIYDKFDGSYWYDSKHKVIKDITNRIHKDCLNSSDVKIHSVKRLSDGEVFTVGDEIKTSVSNSYCSIYGLRLSSAGKLVIECTHSYLAHARSIDLLEDIQQIKQPLFTTEDGVDIFEGDKVYRQNPGTGSILNTIVGKSAPLKDRKYFSTIVAAEEHILMGYKGLSINDVKKQMERNLFSKQDTETLTNKLKKLVKSRR